MPMCIKIVPTGYSHETDDLYHIVLQPINNWVIEDNQLLPYCRMSYHYFSYFYKTKNFSVTIKQQMSIWFPR